MKSILFLTENETQGFAYNEMLSMGVPILAWNCGRWCDPNRFLYGLSEVPATSVPYWDARCGEIFRGKSDFQEKFGVFLDGVNSGFYKPRDYVLDNLRLDQGAVNYLHILEEARQTRA